MEEVSGPIIAIALVLCAVFVPTAFISGLTGQFYQQFALTIAISTVISAFNSLTLSPALVRGAAQVPRRAEGPTRHAHASIGCSAGSSARSTASFTCASERYGQGVGRRALRKASRSPSCYAALIGLHLASCSSIVPTGFIPTQDKQYLIAFAQLPDAASLDRTEAVIRRMSDIALEAPGVAGRGGLPGPVASTASPTAPTPGSCSSASKPFDERKAQGSQRPGHRAARSTSSSPASRTRSSPCSRRRRSGPRHHRRLQAADRGPRRPRVTTRCTARLQGALGEGLSDAAARGRLLELSRSTCRSSTPTSIASRPRARRAAHRRLRDAAGLPRLALRERLQPLRPHLPGHRAGRRPVSRAAGGHPRSSRRATAKGQMVPLGSLVTVSETHGPDRVMRYNGYPGCRHQRRPRARLQLAARRMRAIAKRSRAKRCRTASSFEWTELTYQQILAGNTTVLRLPAVRAARVPGAGRAVRELVAAAGGHPDRADVPALSRSPASGSRAATTTSSRRSASSCWSAWRARTRS